MLDSVLTGWSWYPALVVLLGYVVFGLTGFGSALVIIPLLSWTWPLSLVVPIVLLLDVFAAIAHTGMNLQQVRWSAVPKVLPFAIVGAWLGSQLHQWSDSFWAVAALGLYICAVAIRGLRGRAGVVKKASTLVNAIVGTLMGLIETLFGTAGPLVMAWLNLQERNIEDIRATAPLMILTMVCLALLSNGLSAHSDMGQVFAMAIWLVPIALVGGWSGQKLNSFIQPAHAAKMIYSVLLASGVGLLMRSVLS